MAGLAVLVPRGPTFNPSDMARIQGWEQRGAAWLREARARPLNWRDAHCAFLAADAALAVTGQDPASEWRGRTSAAMRAQSAQGIFALVPYAEISPTKAQRFDIAGFISEHGEALGVCIGREALAYVAEGQPPVRIPMSKAIKAWKVE